MSAPAAPPPTGPPASGGPTGAADELPIDVDLIKVLASDSRRDILRLLGERRKTLTELSEALQLKKATVLEHLKKLQDANLIRRLDQDERLWIYYELTPRGKRLVNPGRTRFFLVMAGSIAAVVTIAAIVVAASMLGATPWSPDEAEPGASPAPGSAGSEGVLATDGRDVTGPTVLWRGIDDNVTLVLATAPPGSRVAIGPLAAPAATVPTSDGLVTLSGALIDALPLGVQPLTLLTDEGPLALDATVSVRDPPIAVTPLAVREGRNATLSLHAGAPGEPRSVRSVGLGDRELLVVTSNAGQTFQLPALPVGDVTLAVGRLATVRVEVLPDLPLATREENGSLAIRTLPNATVVLDGAELGTANASGELLAAWPMLGEHALGVVAPDGRSERFAFHATDSALAPLAPRLTLDAFHGGGPQVLSVHVDLRNLGPADETVTLVAETNGRVVASTLVRVEARGSTTANLRADVDVGGRTAVHAYAARDGTVEAWAVRMRAPAAGASQDASAPPAQPTIAGTPAMTAPTGQPASEVAYYAPGVAPDASVTLVTIFPTTSPETVTAFEESPEVPGPGTGAILAAVAVAALVLALRRRDARRP